MNILKNIYFYCPSKKIGGEQQLFIRCSKELSRCSLSRYRIFYIDYIDGFARQQLIGEKIEFVEYSVNQIIDIREESCVIIALSNLPLIEKKFSFKTVCFMLWSLQPMNLVGMLQIRSKFSVMLPSSRKRIKYLVEYLYSTGTIQFMDFNNYHSLHTVLNVNINDIKYLPIPIEDTFISKRETLSFTRRSNTEKLTLMWLSRIDHDKKHTLMTVMNELNDCKDEFPSRLIVVGDGNALEEVKSFADKIKLEVVFTGRLFGKELDQLIDDYVDVGIGMGTSGLEIAKRGKPVIMKMVLSKTYKSGVITDYIFLHQEYGYSLGSPDFYTEGQSNFRKKLSEIKSDYETIAQMDYEYVVNNHSMHSICNKLLDQLKRLEHVDLDMQHEKLHLLMREINRVRNYTLRNSL